MAKSLAQYAAENPQEMPELERAQKQQAAEDRAQELKEQRIREQMQAKVKRLKESIAAQLEQGNAPQAILYSALEAIGILTADEEWAEAGKQCLDKVYDGLAQQSLLTDNAVIEAHRAAQMQASYNDRLRRQLNRQLSGYQKIARGLNEALAALDELEE